MPVEVANVLHRHVARRELAVGAAASLLRNLMNAGVELHEYPELHIRALELANRLQQGSVCDALYLALAEVLECNLWTADGKFQRAAAAAGGKVLLIDEFRERQS